MAIPRQHKIKDKAIFANIRRTGRSVATTHLGVRVMRGLAGVSKISVIVPVRVAPKASRRNLIRRRVSESVRKQISRLKSGCAILITVNSVALPRGAALEEEMVLLLEKSGILNG